MPRIAAFLVFAALLLFGANAAAQAPLTVTRIACVGEHSTDSGRVENPLEYPARLQLLLGDAYQVAEFGFGTASLTATSFPTTKYVDSPEYAASVAFEPQLVIVGPWGRGDVVGTVHIDDGANNNVALYQQPTPLVTADFQAALDSLVAAYQALPQKPAVLVALPLPFPYGTGEGHMADIILPVTQQLAAAKNLPTIDLWLPFMGLRDEFEDADHLSPSPGGMEHLAQVVATAVQAHQSGMPGGGGSGGAAGGTAGSAAEGGASGMAGGSATGGSIELPAMGGAAGSVVSGPIAGATQAPSPEPGAMNPANAASTGSSHSSGSCAVVPAAPTPSPPLALYLLAAIAVIWRRELSARRGVEAGDGRVAAAVVLGHFARCRVRR